MNNEKDSVAQTRAIRILTLMPELDRRFAVLRGLLEQAGNEEAINDTALWLAQGDLKSVLGVMDGSGIFEEDDDMWFCEN